MCRSWKSMRTSKTCSSFTSTFDSMAANSSELHADSLHFRVGLGTLAPILAAPPGLLVTTERHRVVDTHSAVDAHRARLDLARQLVRDADVAGPHVRRQPVVHVIRDASDAVQIIVIDGHGAHDGPENLLLHHPHVRLRLCKHSRLHEVTTAAFDALATNDHLGTLLSPRFDVARHAIELLLRHEWPHLRLRVETRAHFQFLRAIDHAFDDAIEHLLVHVQARAGDAHLPG